MKYFIYIYPFNPSKKKTSTYFFNRKIYNNKTMKYIGVFKKCPVFCYFNKKEIAEIIVFLSFQKYQQ